MKVFHFVLLFLMFFIAIILKTDINIGKLKAIENEKAVLTRSLDSSTSDAINYLVSSGVYGANSIHKDEVVATFLTSFYSSMGIISDVNAQIEIELYIPVILLCDLDGFYIYYYDEYTEDSKTYIERRWSEKMPYFYEDNNFIYRFTLKDHVVLYDKNNILGLNQKVIDVDYHEFQKDDNYMNFRLSNSDSFLLNDESYEYIKKGAIMNQLEEVLSYYTSKHNFIASRNGITYDFSFPSGKGEEWGTYIDDVNLLIVFQGYPYGVDRNYTYNKVASAGANIIKKPVYYVEQKSWYYLAHIKGCAKLKESETVLEETFSSLEECSKIGAYCCECIGQGAEVPDID